MPSNITQKIKQDQKIAKELERIIRIWFGGVEKRFIWSVQDLINSWISKEKLNDIQLKMIFFHCFLGANNDKMREFFGPVWEIKLREAYKKIGVKDSKDFLMRCFMHSFADRGMYVLPGEDKVMRAVTKEEAIDIML